MKFLAENLRGMKIYREIIRGVKISWKNYKGYENFPYPRRIRVRNDKGYEIFPENHKGSENFPFLRKIRGAK